MKVLYHHRTQGEEPESIHIMAIVEALRGLGHEVKLVGPAEIGPRSQVKRPPGLMARIKEAVPRPMVELLQIAYNLAAWRRLSAAIKAYQPDLIYERYGLYSFVGPMLAKRHGVPLVLEVNTPYAQAWAKYFGLYFARLAKWIELRTFKAAGHIITVTDVQRGMLEDVGVPRNHITVCHNAIAPEEFDPHHPGAAAMREQWKLGSPGETVVVGFVGTMNRWQGIPEFPQVVDAVLKRCANVKFFFVGDGEFRPVLQQHCEQAGLQDRVVFAGRQPHAAVPALVAAMDIAVLLNSNEHGSPMKIFEYYGMGRAIVAPAVGPVREIMQDGVTGLMIEPGNVGQMVERIVTLAGDAALRQRLGAAGREYVIANHTWTENARKALQAYEGLRAAPR